MTSDAWEPPEYYSLPNPDAVIVCDHCGASIVDMVKHTKWHFRDSVRGRDSYGADLRITEQQVKDYGYSD